jgi:hypothetical protein
MEYLPKKTNLIKKIWTSVTKNTEKKSKVITQKHTERKPLPRKTHSNTKLPMSIFFLLN